MARGKYLSLEEARKMGRPEQFAKEHPAEGDCERVHLLMGDQLGCRLCGGYVLLERFR